MYTQELKRAAKKQLRNSNLDKEKRNEINYWLNSLIKIKSKLTKSIVESKLVY